MKTHNKAGRSNKKDRSVALPHYIMDTMAWARLSVTARAALLEFIRAHNGGNNGKIAMSERTLKDKLGVSKNTANRAIAELTTFGFLLRTRAATFFSKRIAAEYLMTHLPDDRSTPPAMALRTFQNIGKTAALKIVRGDDDD